MANFAPLKNRFLMVLDHNLELFGIQGYFLDYGCGTGDVSKHLVHSGGMSGGVAYDPLFTKDILKKQNESTSQLLTFTNKLDSSHRGFDLSVLFDIIEHIPDAESVLADVHKRLSAVGWLVVTIPYNSREWGIDDDFYGHLRRLSRNGVISLLERNRWRVVRVLDPTFPTFWFIRRVFLFASRFTGRFLNQGNEENVKFIKEKNSNISEEIRSLSSAMQNSWNVKSRLAWLLSGNIIPWNLVRKIDMYFESIFLGFELFVLCKKTDKQHICAVCRQGIYSYYKTFHRFSYQKCGFCGSEVSLLDYEEEKELYNTGYYSKEGNRFGRLMESAVRFFRRQRTKFLLKLEPPDPSILDIGCGRGLIPAEFKKMGWRALGTQRSETAANAARKRGADVVLAEIEEIPVQHPFGLVTMYHVIEHLSDLSGSLDHIVRLVCPGGYLVLEYPNGQSILKSMTGLRWFAYDPPYHRHQINPIALSDILGLNNFRLVSESNFSAEYSFFVFAQTMCNVLMPFQRDTLYRALWQGRLSIAQKIWAIMSVPVFALSLALFPAYQLVSAALRRSCIVRQVYRKMSIPAEEFTARKVEN